MRVSVEINGSAYEDDVEPRTLLSDFIRHQAGLTGTKVGCEQGVCGACTVQLDGEPVRSCLMLAVQANGRTLRTVEGLSANGELHPLQRAFNEAHALQCGFCTPGFLLTLKALRDAGELRSREDVIEGLDGSVCRCTGYKSIVEAAEALVAEPAGAGAGR